MADILIGKSLVKWRYGSVDIEIYPDLFRGYEVSRKILKLHFLKDANTLKKTLCIFWLPGEPDLSDRKLLRH